MTENQHWDWLTRGLAGITELTKQAHEQGTIAGDDQRKALQKAVDTLMRVSVEQDTKAKEQHR